jgi:tellurite resistance protein
MLNLDEKNAFYSLAHTLAASHDGISEAELSVLNSVAQEMGITAPAKIKDIQSACSDFSNTESKHIAILELMLIALVDDNFANEEEAVITQIVQLFGLSEAKIERAASWAESLLSQHRSGLRFIKS